MSIPSLKGRRALVTGAAGGIGAAIAIRLATEGVAVAVNDIQPEGCAATTDSIKAEGARAVSVPGDVSNRQSACRIVEDTVSQLGGLDILINNAGIEHRAPFVDYPSEDWDRVLRVNLTAPFVLTQLAAPHLSASGRGAVVNISSIAVIGVFGQPAYDASKGGLQTLTRSTAVELGRVGIRANAVCPGFIRTDMAMAGDLGGIGGKQVAKLPVSRYGEPGEVANAVVWLASDEASYVTGHSLFVDGGMVRR